MNIDEITFLPKKVLDAMSENGRIKELNKIQKEIVERKLWKDNIIISAPTASGKTLASELIMLNKIINEKKSVVYIVPLRALAQEKYKEFKHKYEPLGIKVALSMGDMDSNDYWLSSYDIIVVTSEKLDSLIRHNSPFLANVGLVIVDEIHLIGDISRGPVVEMVITQLRNILKDVQIVGLSATISNDHEFAEWLGAKLIKSNERSIVLKKGVLYNHTILMEDGSIESIRGNNDEIIDFVNHILQKRKQLIIFVNSKKQAEHLAKKIATHVDIKEFENERKKIAKKAYEVLETPTEQCLLLRAVLEKGIAFHHSGLVNEQRAIIEDEFRKRRIKVIVATPTLAMGVNLPSTYVLVKDLYRYVKGRGMLPLPVLEWEQMVGRAGRPKYDEYGVGLAYGKNEVDKDLIMERYVKGESEPLFSKLGVEPILRFHILGLISTRLIKDLPTLLNFFKDTFFAYQYGGIYELKAKLSKVINDLAIWGFLNIKREGDIKGGGLFVPSSAYEEIEKYEITPLGKRVVELYIDPLSAHIIIEFLQHLNSELSIEDLLFLFSLLQESHPLPTVSKKERENIWNKGIEILTPNIERFAALEGIDIEEEEIKYVLIMKAWIEEWEERDILQIYNVYPGELRGKVEIAEWLCYATEEITKLLDISTKAHIIKTLQTARQRVKYGVKEDIIELVKLKGIGRIKARKLRNIGIKRISDLRKIDKGVLSEILGKKWIEKNLKSS